MQLRLLGWIGIALIVLSVILNLWVWNDHNGDGVYGSTGGGDLPEGRVERYIDQVGIDERHSWQLFAIQITIIGGIFLLADMVRRPEPVPVPASAHPSPLFTPAPRPGYTRAPQAQWSPGPASGPQHPQAPPRRFP